MRQMPPVHPAANLFPMLPPDELQALADDIRVNGLQQPVVMFGAQLLDGRNRWKACEMAGVEVKVRDWSGSSPTSFVLSMNLKRRHLTPSEAAALAPAVRDLFKEEARAKMLSGKKDPTQRIEEGRLDREAAARAAKEIGTNRQYVYDIETIHEADPRLVDRIRNGELTVPRAIRQVKQEQKKKELDQAKESISKDAFKNVADLRHCSMSELFASGIKCDAIISDPPYPEEFVHLYGELAKCAKDLVPVVAVMCGQSYLPRILADMCKHLEYRWCFSYLTPGGQAVQLWDRNINTFWKPILVFGEKGDRWAGDVVKSDTNDNDKRFHDWGQSESGMLRLVEALTRPGQTICDPFMGAGTTGVVALAAGRKFIGCDIDAAHVETTRGRIAEVLSGL